MDDRRTSDNATTLTYPEANKFGSDILCGSSKKAKEKSMKSSHTNVLALFKCDKIVFGKVLIHPTTGPVNKQKGVRSSLNTQEYLSYNFVKWFYYQQGQSYRSDVTELFWRIQFGFWNNSFKRLCLAGGRLKNKRMSFMWCKTFPGLVHVFSSCDCNQTD